MTQPELFALMDKFAADGLTRLEYEAAGARVVLEKGAAPAPVSAPVPAAPAAPGPAQEQPGAFIKAPLVGTFYAAAQPGEAPFVKPGDRVKKGQTVCILEAMKMINEIPAPCDCVIEQVLAEDGALMSFDQPMFAVREL